MDDFIVSGDYNGYVYVGNAQGNFETRDGEKRPYYNIYVLSPVSSFQSEDYMGFGLKAEKLKCVDAEVWQGLYIGEQVKLFFDDKKRVQMVASEGLPPFKKAAPDKPKDAKTTVGLSETGFRSSDFSGADFIKAIAASEMTIRARRLSSKKTLIRSPTCRPSQTLASIHLIFSALKPNAA